MKYTNGIFIRIGDLVELDGDNTPATVHAMLPMGPTDTEERVELHFGTHTYVTATRRVVFVQRDV